MRPVTQTEIDEAFDLDPVAAEQLAEASARGDEAGVRDARDALRHARYVEIDAEEYHDNGTRAPYGADDEEHEQ